MGTAIEGMTRWGQLDMAGEVFEWDVDWFASAYADPCTDCAYLTATTSRVGRGGYFVSVPSLLLVTNRGGNLPARHDNAIGFRCARTP